MSENAAFLAQIARLDAQQQCKDLVLAAASAVDRQDYAALADLFSLDATLVRPGGKPLQGRAAIYASYADKDPDRLTLHVITNHTVQLQNPQLAFSQCVVQLYATSKRKENTLHGQSAEPRILLGQLADRLVHTEHGWRIEERRAWFDMHFAPADNGVSVT